MLTLVAVVHILISLCLIGLVLVQDSKGGGASGILGGGGSNSLLGATGATTLFERMTRWFAVAFACTCILLTVLTAQNNTSVLDSYVPPAAVPELPSTPAPTNQGEAPGALKTDSPSAPTAAPAAPAPAPGK